MGLVIKHGDRSVLITPGNTGGIWIDDKEHAIFISSHRLFEFFDAEVEKLFRYVTITPEDI